MKGIIKNWREKSARTIKRNPWTTFWLGALLLVALFVRVYRLDQLLGFYFDQGRDALVIWQFWHEGNFFLVGPTTGIEGILRGPWYYWLISPFYLLGGGDPVWPAVFLAFTTVVSLGILYYLANQIAGKTAGFLAVFIASLSFFLVLASRWLSNPTPMLLLSMLLVWGLFLVLDGKRWAWILIAFALGMAMQFGSAGEIFYFPAVGIFAIWQRKNLPDKKIFLVSAIAFFISFVPQILFDIRHNGVLLAAIKKFLFDQESFKLSFFEVFKIRADLYYTVFYSKLFPANSTYWMPFLGLFGVSLLFNAKKLFQNKRFLVVLLVLASPLVGMLFFQGNYGNVYDYYFTGYYFLFVLLFAVSLAAFSRRFIGFLLVAVFISFFISDNVPLLRNYITAGADGPTHISLGNELQAVDWVLGDAEGRGEEFNVDVYVPPVIPHAYDYLFLWRTKDKCGDDQCGMVDGQVPLLYTLYEVDTAHPERLRAWLDRQKGIGIVDDEVQFGGIVAQRRHRIIEE